MTFAKQDDIKVAVVSMTIKYKKDWFLSVEQNKKQKIKLTGKKTKFLAKLDA